MLFTPVDRVHLIKMSFLPKFLYVFKHIPIHIPNTFFAKLNQAITSFIWASFDPRSTLQLTLSEAAWHYLVSRNTGKLS